MQESARDLVALVVAQAGRVVTTGDPREPWRLVDADGVVVEPVRRIYGICRRLAGR
ncbi:MAG: hypothetical protein WKF47_02135 [Geodermatophilaceae bacterium]|jgi:hypothetical protein